MDHARNYLGAALLGILLSGPGRATAGDTTPVGTAATAQQAWSRAAAASLSAMPDADALATAGVLAGTLPDGKARSIDLLDRAVAAAPRAADLGLLDITVCSGQPGCDALKREARLRSVDPRNGNLWMVALHEASVRKDRKRIDSVLTGMAQATTFNLHSAALGRRFLAALKHVPPPPGAASESADASRQLQAMSMVTIFAMPAMHDLVDACRPADPVSDTRRQTCRTIAGSLSQSDALITELIGLRLQAWNARDAADRDQALARRRRLQWKIQELNAATRSAAVSPANQISSMLAHDREVESIDAMLRAGGRSLDPPPHWQPPESGAVPPGP